MTAGGGFLLVAGGLALGIALGWLLARLLFSRRLLEQRQALERAQSEARADPLTGLGNRKAFEEQLQILTAIARRYGGPLSLILFDLDGLKQVNDTRGHAAGDAALVHFATVLRTAARQSDISARFGGDEFAVLLPHTDARGAGVLAERIRHSLQSTPCPWPAAAASPPATRDSLAPAECNRPLGVSSGIAEWLADDTSAKFLERADEALYRTKHAGGDRTAIGPTHDRPK